MRGCEIFSILTRLPTLFKFRCRRFSRRISSSGQGRVGQCRRRSGRMGGCAGQRWRDGRRIAGSGRKSQCDGWQINGANFSEPKQFPEDPAAFVLLERRVGLNRRDL